MTADPVVIYGTGVDDAGASFARPQFPRVTAEQLNRLIGNPLAPRAEEEDVD